MVKIAQISCGTDYSGVQKEIEKAASTFGAEITIPEADLDYIDEAYHKFGFNAASSSVRLMIARACPCLRKSDVRMRFMHRVSDVPRQHWKTSKTILQQNTIYGLLFIHRTDQD